MTARVETTATMFRQRDHAPDAAHLELAPAEPLTEVARGRGRDDALPSETHRIFSTGSHAARSASRGHVERDGHEPDDLVAMLVARREDVGLGHRTNSHAHGFAPHLGHPFA